MLLTAALAYARHGIPVLPVHTAGPGGCSCDRGSRCERPGKHPHLRHGLTEATTDPLQIEIWWERWPEANVGLRTGVVMDVADVDSEEGWHGLRHVLGGSFPPGPLVRTGSGGWHFWFHPTGFGNRVRLLPGLDWRGSGGYVVAPPSRHASGADYRWVRRPGDDLPAGPPALRELIEGPPVSYGSWPHGSFRHRSLDDGSLDDGDSLSDPSLADRPLADRPADRPFAGRSADRPFAGRTTADRTLTERPIAYPDRYAKAALTAEADRVARAPIGARNDTLNRAAFALGRLVGAGLLNTSEVTRELESAALFAGLGRAETRSTIRSGLTAGRRTPLTLPPIRHAA
jgi:hypothetical protein